MSRVCTLQKIQPKRPHPDVSSSQNIQWRHVAEAAPADEADTPTVLLVSPPLETPPRRASKPLLPCLETPPAMLEI